MLFLMTFNGLPLHPLVVHLTVVALPVLILVSLASLHPRWRNRLRLPAVGLALVTAVLVWFTAKTGESLRDQLGGMQGLIDAHENAADRLKWATYGFALLAAARFAFYDRAGWVRWLLGALVVGGVVALGIFTYQTGDAGARLIYGR